MKPLTKFLIVIILLFNVAGIFVQVWSTRAYELELVVSSGSTVAVTLQDPGGSGSYKFDSSEFAFSAGETVSFTFSAESEFHTFTVDDLGIDVSVDGGSSETLTFTFVTPGEYKLICIPHESLGMVGTITVQ